MQSCCQLPQLVQRPRKLFLGLLDRRSCQGACGDTRIREPRFELPEPTGRAFAQSRLEPPAFGVGRFEQTAARSLELCYLRLHVRLQLRVRSGEPRCGRDGVHEPWIVEDRRIVNEHCDLFAVAFDSRHLPRRIGRQALRQTGRVDVPAVEPIGDLERRVAERLRERVANRPSPGLAEVHDEVRDRGPLPRTPPCAVREVDGDAAERGLVCEQRRVARACRVRGEVHGRDDAEDGDKDAGGTQRVACLAAAPADGAEESPDRARCHRRRDRDRGRVVPP